MVDPRSCSLATARVKKNYMSGKIPLALLPKSSTPQPNVPVKVSRPAHLVAIVQAHLKATLARVTILRQPLQNLCLLGLLPRLPSTGCGIHQSTARANGFTEGADGHSCIYSELSEVFLPICHFLGLRDLFDLYFRVGKPTSVLSVRENKPSYIIMVA